MKKTLVIALGLAAAACATTKDSDNGLVRFDGEPKNCEYLYTIDSSATTYQIENAYEYLEKTILEQGPNADAYYIETASISENPGAVFGPKNTYKFKAKVYSCKK